VHFHDGLASGPLVQEIDVLRDDGLDEAEPLELREGGVRGFGSASVSIAMRGL
jgi:hypothetical protein